jgi:hypothetical protein
MVISMQLWDAHGAFVQNAALSDIFLEEEFAE